MIFNFIFLFSFVNMPAKRKHAPSKSKRTKRSTSSRGTTYARKGRYLGGTQKNTQSDRIPTCGIRAVGFRNSFALRGPVPVRSFCTHRYVECNSITANAISGLSNTPVTYRLNTGWDPNISGVGHQAYGWNEMGNFYGLYTITHVSVQIDVYSNLSTTAAVCWQIQSSQASGATFIGRKYEDFLEKPACGAVLCNVSTGTQNVTSINLGKMSIAEIDGIPEDRVINDDVYSANKAAIPSFGPILFVGCVDAGGNVNAFVNYTITFVYHAIWTNRKDLPVSS